MNTNDHVFRAECGGLPDGMYCVVTRRDHGSIFMMKARVRPTSPILFYQFFTEDAALNAANRWVKRKLNEREQHAG